MTFRKLFTSFWIFSGIITLYSFLFISEIENEVPYSNVAHIFMLNTLEIWEKVSPAKYHFSPVQTFPDAKKYNHYYKRLEDKEGNNYYVSHPPGAFLLNYVLFSAFSLPMSNASLQWILFVLWVVMFFFVFCWLSKIFKAKEFGQFYVLLGLLLWGSAGPILYLFSRHNFSEAWGFFFFASWLIFYDFSRRFNKNLYLLLLLLFSFFLAYADWLGLGLMLVGGWYLFFSKNPLQRKTWKKVVISLLVGYVIVFLQYTSIDGVFPFLKALSIRFVERSGFFGVSYTDMGYHLLNPETWKFFALNIWNVLVGGGLFCMGLLAFLLISKGKSNLSLDKEMFFVSFVPVFIYTLFLFSATATHYIYVAKWYIPLYFLVIPNLTNLKPQLVKIYRWIGLVVSFALLLMAYYEFRTHIPAIEPEKKQYMDELANQIRLNRIDSLRLEFPLEERDIIYLSWKSKRNLVWVNEIKSK